MNVLKNFKRLKESVEEFPCIQIRYDDEVFAELPVCLVPFNVELQKPCLYPNGNGIPIAVEYEWLIETLSKLKKFYCKVDEEGHLKVVAPKEANQILRLPPDTKIEDIILKNGQIFKKEPNKEVEKKKGDN